MAVWNETLTFQINQNEDEMVLLLMDRCMLVDAKLGEAKVRALQVHLG